MNVRDYIKNLHLDVLRISLRQINKRLEFLAKDSLNYIIFKV